MPYFLRCDSCDFSTKVSDEIDTYSVAKDHERDEPDHFVFIEQEN